MFLDIHELERNKREFDEHVASGRLDLGKEISQTGPLDAQGSAELLESNIRLRGRLQTEVEVSCARCLESIRRSVSLEFDLFYQPLKTIAREEDVEIKPAELEIGFYQGNGLWLEDVLKEQVLLALPMKSICRPDCAGLCPRCGQNRNLAACGCRPLQPESPWAPLTGLQK